MLTHEELKDKYQELIQAMIEATDILDANDCIHNLYPDTYYYIIDKLVNRIDSLSSAYFENRDSVSDADAKEIISLIESAYGIVAYAGWDT